jgi:hypothetical protein
MADEMAAPRVCLTAGLLAVTRVLYWVVQKASQKVGRKEARWALRAAAWTAGSMVVSMDEMKADQLAAEKVALLGSPWAAMMAWRRAVRLALTTAELKVS